MREKTISLSERNLMFVIGGQLFDQAPNREPRNAESIMKQVRDKFRENAVNFNEFYSLNIKESELEKYLKDLLMGIEDFVKLNLTHKEVHDGITIDDPSFTSGKYKFVTAYYKYYSESWKSDFIDLDAFIGNITWRLICLITTDNDCVFCKHTKSYRCKTCIHNEKFTNRYEGSRKPKGDHKFSCKYDCPYDYQICCEECKKNDTCTKVCESKSDTCGLKVLE